MAFPVTLNGRTYTLTDFEGTNYVDGLPDAFEDFVTHAGDIYNSTSTTSNSIGTGSKTFTVEANKPYQAGTPLRIADAAAPSTNFLDTVVTSYSGTTLVVNSIGYGGSGTKTSWTVNIGGAKTVDGTLGLSQGGTGATDAAGARTNIDVYSKADADSRFLNVSGEASDVTMNGNTTIGDSSTDTLTVRATTTFTNIGTGAAAGPYVNLFRDSSSPADDDFIGILSWQGKNDADQIVTYGQIAGRIADASDGSEDARIDLQAIVAGTTRSIMQYESGLTQFNAAGQDIDFKVHSTSHTDMFFLDANLSRIGIKTSSLTQELNIDGNFGFSEGSWIGHTDGSARIAFRDDNLGVTGNSMQIASSNDIVVATMSNAAGSGNIYFGSKALDPTEAGWQTNIFFGTEGSAIFNESSVGSADFRVESDSNSHMLFVDAGQNLIGIGQSANLHGNRLNIEKSDSQTDGPEIVMKNLYQASSGADELGSINFGGWRDVASTGSYTSAIGGYDVTYPGTSGQLRFFTKGNGNADPSSVRDNAHEMMRITDNEVILNEHSADNDFRVESSNYTHALFVDASEDTVVAENQMRIGGVTGSSHSRFQVNVAHTPSIPNTTSGDWDSTDSDGINVFFAGSNEDAWGGKAIGGVYSKWKTPTTENWVGFDFIDDRTANNSAHRGSLLVRTRNSGSGDRAVWQFSHNGSFFPLTDDLYNIGASSYRINDIYATNATIQTSDENQKQQIAALTDAEMTAAKAISKLFKTFKWNSAVEAKGDAARTHSGVIAQQVEQAMTDAGLDADDYAFFVRAVHYTDTVEGRELLFDYDDDERTETATKHEKLAIRYPELLSFIGAATEQRLTSIESRLDALEST